MNIVNGKCPNCGAALVIDSTAERGKCPYCGSEVLFESATQKIKIEGIADFDTLMLSAQMAIEREDDFDKARQKYKEALDLKPNDYRALWGLFLCEMQGVTYHYQRKGFVQYPGDTLKCVNENIKRYGNPAYELAPDDTKKYYEQKFDEYLSLFNDKTENDEPETKKGCYIATSVYGSYDCPEVWVLRRYRDFCLEQSFVGKMFVKIYYAVSPFVIRVFGRQKWFNTFWRKFLNKKIEKLKNNGVQDTPYDDNI